MNSRRIEERLRTEIEELHDFFAAWYRGDPDGPGARFERLERALAPDFTLVSPEGALFDRETLIRLLQGARGGRPGFRIEVKEFAVLASESPLHAASYEERQSDGERRTARLSTALFREAETAPRGLLWVRVHETWLLPPASAKGSM